jgi:hypothetical protein
MLSPVQNSPSNSPRVFALEEEGFGLAILESEDLAVAADVQLTLHLESAIAQLRYQFCHRGDPVAAELNFRTFPG